MRKKPLKSKFKITPAIQKNLETIADSLPAFQRKDTEGNLLTRKLCIVVEGSEVTELEKAQIKNFDVNLKYKRFTTEPLLVNHRIALRLTYLELGQPGVDRYCEFYTDMFEHQTMAGTKQLRIEK